MNITQLGDTFTPMNPKRGNGFYIYFIGKCDTCDGDIQEPNATAIYMVTGRWLAEAGLSRREHMPPEIFFCDESREVVCDNCAFEDEE